MSRHIDPCWHCQKEHEGVCWAQDSSTTSHLATPSFNIIEDNSNSSSKGDDHEMPRHIFSCAHCPKWHNGTCWTQDPSRAPRWWKRKHQRKLRERKAIAQEEQFHPFMRLPAELRVQIYDWHWLGDLGWYWLCHEWQDSDSHWAMCVNAGTTKRLRCYECHHAECKYSGALLLASKQVRREALPVLLDMFQVKIRIDGLMAEDAFEWRIHNLEAALNMPAGIKTCHIELNAWPSDKAENNLPLLLNQLKPLHALAERVTFVIEVQDRCLWPWPIEEYIPDIAKKPGYRKAKNLRKAVVRGLEAEFAKEGKTLRVQDYRSMALEACGSTSQSQDSDEEPELREDEGLGWWQ